MLIALTLMAFDHRNPSMTSPVRTLFSIIGYPLQLIVDTPFRAYDITEDFFADHTLMSRKNDELNEALLKLKAKYRNMEIIEQQNKRLRELLKVGKRPDYTFTMAEILAASDYRGQSVVTLNKGSRAGVSVKQVVVAQGGSIFGQVIEVTPFSSQVMLITDIQHAIPVRNERTNKRALASGTGKPDFMELKSIVASSNVKDGDIFVTSGLDGLFPADFPVAMVLPNGVNYVPGDPFANIQARPLINFENTREVLLLWRNRGADDAADNPEADGFAEPGSGSAPDPESSTQQAASQ